MLDRSNYIFKGVNVSICEHWTGEWEVLDSNTGEILYLVPDRNRALEVYDELNGK